VGHIIAPPRYYIIIGQGSADVISEFYERASYVFRNSGGNKTSISAS